MMTRLKTPYFNYSACGGGAPTDSLGAHTGSPLLVSNERLLM